MGLLKDFVHYLRHYRRMYLIPLFIILLLLALIALVTQGPTVGSLFYALF